MVNMDRIFENTKCIETKLIDDVYKIIIKDRYFGGQSVEEIRGRFKYIIDNKTIEYPQILLRIHSRSINDNSTIVVFEALLIQLVEKTNAIINIEFRRINIKDMSINYLDKSLLSRQIKVKDYGLVIKLNSRKFKSDFYKKKIIDKAYYRSFFAKGVLNRYSSSKVKSDIKTFLNPHFSDNKVIGLMSEVACELVGNVYDHANSDCILEVTISEVEHKKTKKDFKAINMTVLNFSKTILISHIQDYFVTNRFTKKAVDESILRAYNFHESHFTSKYSRDHFYMISLFQRNFTTRVNRYITGGTGLTRLIESLTGRAYEKYSYVMTGNKVIYFTDKLKVSEDGYVGFNDSNDYFGSIPDPEIIDFSQFYLEGTLYNLSFIIDEEDINEKI
jgi:hypothetical protein